jgi:alkylation response protein AidB-like acyl-CoA dehydrogenase
MPASAQQTEIPPQPLTALTEEEKLFQTTVRQFAREQIGPHVREMDEAGVFRKDIIRQFFELGLMGIEIPKNTAAAAAASSNAFWRWRNCRPWTRRPA